MQYIFKIRDRSILQILIVLKHITVLRKVYNEYSCIVKYRLYSRFYSKKGKESLKTWLCGISIHQFLTLYRISKIQNRMCYHLSTTVSSLLVQKLTCTAFHLPQPLLQKCSFFKLLTATDPIKQYVSCQRKLNRNQYQNIIL